MSRTRSPTQTRLHAWRLRSPCARADPRLARTGSLSVWPTPLAHDHRQAPGDAVTRKRLGTGTSPHQPASSCATRLKSTTMNTHTQPAPANVLDRPRITEIPNHHHVAATTPFVIKSSRKIHLPPALRPPRRLPHPRHQLPTSRPRATAAGLHAPASSAPPSHPLRPHQPSRYARDDHHATLTAHGILPAARHRGNFYNRPRRCSNLATPVQRRSQMGCTRRRDSPPVGETGSLPVSSVFRRRRPPFV